MSLVHMHQFRYRAKSRRAAAWVGDEAGDTMIEVVIAVLIVVLLAGATFTGFSAVSQLSGQQRHQAVANQLAQQDEQRLRGLTATELSATATAVGSTGSTYGNVTYPVTIDGENYTVTSTTRFVAASGGATSCTTSGTSTADYVETASAVSWHEGTSTRAPVIEHSVIAPPTGGSLIVEAELPNTTTGIAGVTITATGPGTSTNVQTLTTDANGCAVFGGLAPGTYAIAETDPGYATSTGITSQSAIVVAGETQTLTFQLGQLGTALATFRTFINGSTTPTTLNWDTFSLYPSTGTTYSAGTVGTYQSQVSSGATVYPTSYSAYAGTCSADDPNPTGSTSTTGSSGSTTPADPTVTVPNGATGSVSPAITVPTMLLKLTTSYGSTNTNVTAATLPYTVASYDSCPTEVYRLEGTPSALVVGSSTVYPVQAPYGTSVQVCFAQGSGGSATNTSYLPSTQIANTNLAGSTITSITLPITSTGAFTHSGLCPTS
jgi:Tfp pilus assembly protein PilE